MLARARLRDDALLAHAAGQQPLAQRIVDLVRAGVQQVFALQIDLRAAQGFAQTLGIVKRRGPTAVVVQQAIELRMKSRVRIGCRVGVFQLQQRRHQGLGDVASAVRAEAAWNSFCRIERCRGHR